MSGTTVFNNLSKTVTIPKTLTFSQGGQQSVSGALTLRGAASNLLSIRGETADTASRLILDAGGGTQTLDYLDIQDNDASGGAELECLTATEGCVNSGNNTNWSFAAAVSTDVGRHRPNTYPGVDDPGGFLPEVTEEEEQAAAPPTEATPESLLPPAAPVVMEEPGGAIKVTIGLPESIPELTAAERERLERARKLERSSERVSEEELRELLRRSEERRSVREQEQFLRDILRPIVREVHPPLKPGHIMREVVQQEKVRSGFLEFIRNLPLGFKELASQTVEKLSDSLEASGTAVTILEHAGDLLQGLLGKSASAIAFLFEKTGLEGKLSGFAARTGLSFVAEREKEKGMGRLLAEKIVTTLTEGAEELEEMLASKIGGPDEHVAAPEIQRMYSTALQKIGETFVIEKLRIVILSPRGTAYAYVPVTLFSTPQRTLTDGNGVAEFKDVAMGEHSMEIHLDDEFVIRKAIIVEAPEGLDIPEGETVDVIIPLINVKVEDSPEDGAGLHSAAPSKWNKALLTRTVIFFTLLSMVAVQVCFLMMLLRRKNRPCTFCGVMRKMV